MGIGDITLADELLVGTMLYNKKMASEFQIGDLYSLVREGNWTIDELIEIKGEHVAVLEMRTIAIWYMKGLKKLKPFKDKVVLVKTRDELIKCIDELIKLQEEV